MKSLHEVLEGIEAFKKDMENLGVYVGVKELGSLLEDGKKHKLISMTLLLPVLDDMEAEA